MIYRYICSVCGKEFDCEEDCEGHERYCGVTKEQLGFVAWDKNENQMDFFNDNDFFGGCAYVKFSNREAFDFFNKQQEYYGYYVIDEDIYAEGHIYYCCDVNDEWIDLTRFYKKITNVYNKLVV